MTYNTGFCIRIALKPTYHTNLTQPQVTALTEVGNLKLTVLYRKSFPLEQMPILWRGTTGRYAYAIKIIKYPQPEKPFLYSDNQSDVKYFHTNLKGTGTPYRTRQESSVMLESRR
jgi:hypothetical protein